MGYTKSYSYKAKNKQSYRSLATFAANLDDVTVTFHPKWMTIVITENAANEVGEYIDNHGLDFHISYIDVDTEDIDDTAIYDSTTDAESLRQIIFTVLKRSDAAFDSLRKELQETKRNLELYKDWHKEDNKESDRVKAQIKAIAVLINTIYPDK